MNNLNLILGGPGCGKTTHLLDMVNEEIQLGILPYKIAFVAFTNAAANEAKTRAQDRFSLSEDDFPWFRTIHSMAFRRLGLQPDCVMDHQDWKFISEI